MWVEMVRDGWYLARCGEGGSAGERVKDISLVGDLSLTTSWSVFYMIRRNIHDKYFRGILA